METPLSYVHKGISIIVPIFNEADSINDFIESLHSVLDSLPFPHEVIFVDDGSTDETPKLLHSLPHKVLRHQINMGYGAAIKSGIRNCRHEAVVILDADGTYAPEDIVKIVKPLDSYDMVVGARTGQNIHIPLGRRPVKWIIRKFAEWMVRRSIPDLNSGLRSFRKSRVEEIIQLLPDGFSLTTTLTVAFMTGNRKVLFEPIRYNKRTGVSKFHPISDTWNMILLILRTVVLIRPLNVFLPLSFALALLAVIVAVASMAAGKFMDTTFIVLMMTSIQMFVLGLIADLIIRINLWTH